MAVIKLRNYQELIISQIDDHFRRGNRRIILFAMPGAGKTTMAAWMIKRAVEYNYPVIFVVRGRELVKNASETLDKYGISHSINMAGHWRYNKKSLVQVCSSDTLKSRKNYPFTDQEPLIFVDEMHKDYKDVYEIYKDAFIIGMSGSPYNDNSMYHAHVCPIEGYELRDQGFLVPEKIYCPHLIDVSAVKKVRGDFDKKQLNTVVTSGTIVGNIVQDWIDKGENRPTVCFAVSIEHSLQLKQAFCDAGISAVHCDASSDDKERKAAKEGLENGQIKVVCNVDIFSIGWDCPIVSCIILARPTMSLVWYIQAICRGIRAYPEKTNCIILDNAGNVFRHGTPYRIREISLNPPEAKRKIPKLDQQVQTCEECYIVYDPELNQCCPECGWIPPRKIRKVKSTDGRLVEYEENSKELEEYRFSTMRSDYYKFEWVRKTKKLNPNWTFTQIQKKYPDVFHLLHKITVVPPSFLKDQQVLPSHELH
jgi:DNA repair protein RadD